MSEPKIPYPGLETKHLQSYTALNRYFHDFEQIARANSVADERAIQILKAKTTDEIRYLISASDTLANVKTELAKLLFPGSTKVQLMQDVMDIFQGKDPVVLYYGRIMSIASAAYDGIAETHRKSLYLAAFLHGLNDQLKAQVKCKDPSSVIEACEFARKFEIGQTGKKPLEHVATIKKWSHPQRSSALEPSDAEDTSSSDNPSDDDGNASYHCSADSGDDVNATASIPRPTIKCIGCGKKGHLFSRCWFNPAREQPRGNKPLNSPGAHRSRDGGPYRRKKTSAQL